MRTVEDFESIRQIGARIKIAREAKEFTQEQVAEAIGISRNNLGQVERGEFGLKMEHFSKLSAFLEADLNVLLAGKSYKQNSENIIDISSCPESARAHFKSSVEGILQIIVKGE